MSTTLPYPEATIIGIASPRYRLPDSAHVQSASLVVSHLRASVSFYRDVIGLAVLREDATTAELGVGTEVLLRLEERPGVQPIGRRTRLGLYHTAFLLPSRAALGSFLKHLHEDNIRYGAGDHLYSEALYLVDPDGLSVEVYADRAKEFWQVRDQELLSGTGSVDIAGVVAASEGEWAGAPEGTTLGHVHLYVGELEEAARFYHQGLGLGVMSWNYPGALFVSAGRYHHHVGLNVWAAGSPPASETDARLLLWELSVPEGDLAKIRENLEHFGWVVGEESGALMVRDPWGITVRIVAATTDKEGAAQ